MTEEYLEQLRLATNNVRMSQQMKAWHYYISDISYLQEYLKTALLKMYSQESVDAMRFNYLPLTKKIIDSVAVVYKRPAKRFVRINGKIDEQLTEYYNSLLPDNVTYYDKLAHRYARLFNVSLIHLWFNGKNFEQEVLPTFYYDVVSSDNVKPDMVSYKRVFIDREGNEIVQEVYHTDNEIYRLDGMDKMPLPDADSIKNPYGKIDFITFRINQDADFWGVGADVLVEANETINLLLTKLVKDDLILGTAGILFGVNLAKALGVDVNKGEDPNNPTQMTKKIKAGRNAILDVETSVTQTTPPDLKYISTNPQVQQVLDAIDWLIKSVASSYGLNPNAFSISRKAESGYARLIEHAEQIEIRQEDKMSALAYEKERFDFIRTAVNNIIATGYPGADNLKRIPENAELVVDFADPEEFPSVDEKWFDLRMRLRYGLLSPADIMVMENPEMSKEDAERIVNENLDKYVKYLSVIGEIDKDLNGGITDKVTDQTK